jgi:hypothetical protein
MVHFNRQRSLQMGMNCNQGCTDTCCSARARTPPPPPATLTCVLYHHHGCLGHIHTHFNHSSTAQGDPRERSKFR